MIFTRELSFTSSKKEKSQTLKDHFIIDKYLFVLIPESYTIIQQCVTMKSNLDNLFSNLKNGV